MPIELTRTDERFAFSNHQWEELLLIAKDFGWQPQDAPDEHWERIYFASNGAVISHRDALALADALKRALPKLPAPMHTLSSNFLIFCEHGSFQID